MPSVTHAVEDYLKAIWKLSHQTRGGKVPVGDIAVHLGISAPSVTGMVQKLKGMRLLHYTRYGGVTLTPLRTTRSSANVRNRGSSRSRSVRQPAANSATRTTNLSR